MFAAIVVTFVVGAVGGYVAGCRWPLSFLRKEAAAAVTAEAVKVAGAISPKA